MAYLFCLSFPRSKRKPLSPFTGLGLFLFFILSLTPAKARAEDPPLIPEAAKDQMVSQAEKFGKDESRLPQAPEKKPEIIQGQKPLPLAPPAGPSFLVKKIIFQGQTIISPQALAEHAASYENKTLYFSDLQELANKITGLYLQKGYTTSRAYLPPQKVQDGIVTVKIMEGKIGDLRFEGNKYFSAKNYQRALALKQGKIFRYQDLEQGLQNVNQKPDREAKAYIVAGKEAETSDLLFKVKDSLPVHASYEFNNFGTKLTHRARHQMRLSHHNVTGFGDSLNGSIALAEQSALMSLGGNYSFPIDATGTTLSMGSSYTRSLLAKHLRPFEIEGRYLSFTPEIMQRLVRRANLKLEALLGFEFKNSKTTIDGTKINVDRVRVLTPGFQTSYSDPWGRTGFQFRTHIGLPSFMRGLSNKDRNASRPGTGGEFLYHTLSLARAQRLPYSSVLLLRTSGHLTHHSLPSIEQFRAGGAYSVRGYPESDAAGDYGYNASAEFNVPVPFLPSDWTIPYTSQTWRQSIRLVHFWDLAKTFNRSRSNDTDIKDKFLLGTGAGVRFNLKSNVSLRFDWGFPLGDESGDKDRSQLHLSSQIGF